MSHPPLARDPHLLAGRLLAAGRAEHPPVSSLPRALAAAAAATSTATIASGALGGSSTGLASHVLLMKWLGGGLLAGALFSAGVEVVVQPRRQHHAAVVQASPAATDAPTSSRGTRATSTGSASLAGVEREGAAIQQAQSRQAQDVAARAAQGGAETPHPPAQSTLADEIALVDSARAAAQRHDPAATLAAVAAYAVRYPAGRFSPEIMALEVEALAARGQPDAARRMARLFLQRYPASPLAERVRSLEAARGFP